MIYQDGEDSYKILAKNPEWVRSYGNPGFICEDKIVTDLIKAGGADADEVYLVCDRHQWYTTVGMVKNL
jgi:hypothetical protein